MWSSHSRRFCLSSEFLLVRRGHRRVHGVGVLVFAGLLDLVDGGGQLARAGLGDECLLLAPAAGRQGRQQEPERKERAA
jgi:hypothetical protein